MLFEQRKIKMKRVAEDSPFFKTNSSQALIEVRFDGREFYVFNRDNAYFEIYGVAEEIAQTLLSIN
jgi:hypothetical protein